jgi:hypothetical protein
VQMFFLLLFFFCALSVLGEITRFEIQFDRLPNILRRTMAVQLEQCNRRDSERATYANFIGARRQTKYAFDRTAIESMHCDQSTLAAAFRLAYPRAVTSSHSFSNATNYAHIRMPNSLLHFVPNCSMSDPTQRQTPNLPRCCKCTSVNINSTVCRKQNTFRFWA